MIFYSLSFPFIFSNALYLLTLINLYKNKGQIFYNVRNGSLNFAWAINSKIRFFWCIEYQGTCSEIYTKVREKDQRSVYGTNGSAKNFHWESNNGLKSKVFIWYCSKNGLFFGSPTPIIRSKRDWREFILTEELFLVLALKSKSQSNKWSDCQASNQIRWTPQ